MYRGSVVTNLTIPDHRWRPKESAYLEVLETAGLSPGRAGSGLYAPASRLSLRAPCDPVAAA